MLLGSTGVLGSQILRFLASVDNVELTATARQKINPDFLARYSNVKFLNLSVNKIIENPLFFNLSKFDVVINAIGAIKQRGIESQEMYLINSIFPRIISRQILNTSSRIIHFTTDCVFSGNFRNQNVENTPHDTNDVYGLSKSFGEIEQNNIYNLRASFIGKEIDSNYSLLGWFLSQRPNATVNGFVNHFWNGIGTLQYAKLVRGIIEEDFRNIPNNLHIVPKDNVTKYELLLLLQEYFKRSDVDILKHQTPYDVFRTLETKYAEINQSIWNIAGYPNSPTIEEMVRELAEDEVRG